TLIDLDWLWQGLLSNGIYASLIVAGGVLLASLKNKTQRLLLSIAWGLIGCALTGIILVAFVVITRIPKAPPPVTPQTIETNVRGWLDNFSLSSKKYDDPKLFFWVRCYGGR